MKNEVNSIAKMRRGYLLISMLCAVLLISSCAKDDTLMPPLQVPGSGVRHAAGSEAVLPVTPNEIVPDKALIYLSRGNCFGHCPVYTVMITRDNIGVYDGIANVAVLGKVQFDVSKDNVQQ